MFHEIPAGIVDPFLYLEPGSRRAATAPCSTRPRRAAGVEAIDPPALGPDELVGAGRDRLASGAEICLRAAASSASSTRVAGRFPGGPRGLLARRRGRDHVDDDVFVRRRRVKTDAQLEASGAPRRLRTPPWTSAAD